jgi:transcriptional regulator with XRE-family HTH domain
MTSLSRQIRQARPARGWSQDQFGEAVGVSGPAVSSWETGRIKPRPRHLARLTKFISNGRAIAAAPLIVEANATKRAEVPPPSPELAWQRIRDELAPDLREMFDRQRADYLRAMADKASVKPESLTAEVLGDLIRQSWHRWP